MKDGGGDRNDHYCLGHQLKDESFGGRYLKPGSVLEKLEGMAVDSYQGYFFQAHSFE